MDRVLGMRLVYKHPEMARAVNFDYMNQEMIWTGLTEFIMFIRPYLPLAKWKLSLKQYWNQDTLDPHNCLICIQKDHSQTKARIPFKTSCGHIFCYYCIQSHLLAHPQAPCPACQSAITDIYRL